MEEDAMFGRKAFVTLAVIAAFGVLDAAPATASKDDIDTRGERGGSVRPCSQDGVNPAHHPRFSAIPPSLPENLVSSNRGTVLGT
jgi:hypothetical protein